MPVVILNGPTGTELIRRGVDCSGPAWSARAVAHAPEVLEQIHREYADAGADVHVACTFRTQPSLFPGTFRELTARAVDIARRSIPRAHAIAGSLAPIADCYRPLQSPLQSGEAGRAEAARLHTAMAEALRDAGADVILCETFPLAEEGLLAARCAIEAARGIPVWLSLTPGPGADLLTPLEVELAARDALALGVAAVMVNCVGASQAQPYVQALGRAVRGAGAAARFGLYANAGAASEGMGWGGAEAAVAALRYAEIAVRWRAAGCSILGSCCGTGPAHTRELAARFS